MNSSNEKPQTDVPFTGEGIFPKGDKNEAYARYFTGTSYLNMLSLERVVIGNVTFEPGCRNFWHIHHKGGQVLLATAGRGWYQEEGENRPGSFVPVMWSTSRLKPSTGMGLPRTAGSPMWPWKSPAEGASNEWLEPVSDEEYDLLK